MPRSNNKSMMFSLMIETYEYNRKTRMRDVVYRQAFRFYANTVIGAKRKASWIIFNQATVHPNYEMLKNPLWWNRWVETDTIPNAARHSDQFYGRNMRADLVLIERAT